MNRLVPSFLAAAGLLGLAACGGGSSGGGTPVSGLTYADPAGTAGNYALVKDAASTPSDLILDLVGPDGASEVGLTFSFTLDTTKATWSSYANGTLFTGTQTLFQCWANGGTLQGIITNKGLANAVSDIGASTGGVIAKLHLAPVAGAAAGPVTLADGGLGTSMDMGGTPIPIHLLVGTLTLN